MYTHPIFGEQHINKSSIDYICSQLYSQIGYSSEDECILDAKKLDNNRLFRIVRINGDGTIRIVADESVGLSQFNENDNLEEYVGYTYKTRIGYGINEKTNLESVRELDISSSYNSYYIYLTDSKFTFDNESKRYVFDGKYECIKASECLNEKAKCEGKYMVTTPQYNSYCSLIPPEKNYWLYKIKEIGKLSDNTMTIKTIDYRFGGSAIFDQNSKDNDSIMKQYLDQWYKDNLNSFDNLLANTRYCNDTTIRSSYPRNDFGFYYSVDFRLSTFSEHIPEPTYICPNTNLDYGGEYDLKIGLLSADEAAFAGGNYGTQNESYYIPKGTVLSSPMDYSFNYETTFSSMFAISYDGSISGSSKYINNVFPVLNIRADTLFTQGDGSKDNPYVVKLNNK